MKRIAASSVSGVATNCASASPSLSLASSRAARAARPRSSPLQTLSVWKAEVLS